VRRPDRVVAIAFSLSLLAALGLAAVYVAGGQPQAEGALLLVALGGIGVGLIVWATALMPGIRDETQRRPRRDRATEAPRGAADAVIDGAEELGRRTLLVRLLVGAAAALGLAALFPIRSLGRAPGGSLSSTPWRAGTRLVTVDGSPVTRETLDVGAFTTVFPEGFVGSADGQAVLINVGDAPLRLSPDALAGAPGGLVCYSKLCTHAGCPVGLYLAAEHQLRCPCHQSTFDVLSGAEPVYGPAPKPLPQLPIEVGGDGALRATGDFTAPVGPSFWDLPPG
jgi:ubiquinol-cytochrome c reductase iron-sulfur subunit